MNKPKECQCEGVIATFHLANGQTRQLRFQDMRKVKLGSKLDGGFFSFFTMAYVHDGTYKNYVNNHRDLGTFCENSLSRGMWSFPNEMVPFLDVVKITKAVFTYEVEIDPEIYQGD